MNGTGQYRLLLRRLATQGSTGAGAVISNSASNTDATVPWFEPRYWIARGAMVSEAQGRGTVHCFKHQGRRFVLRHYRRGGLAAKFSTDRYLWLGEAMTRPVREMNLTLRMHAAGLPVPLPVAARYERDGAGYRGDLITEYLDDTRSLAQCLDAGDVGLDSWTAIGRCLRRFHDYGLWHADLNAHNILLRGATDVFLVDFDRCRRRSPGLWRDANLVRLRRSLDKLEDARSQPPRAQRRFDETQWQCLLSAYF